jgi:hypothetical protein
MILANGPDSYADDCKDTAQFVAEELKDTLSADDWYFAFQPRHEWRALDRPNGRGDLVAAEEGWLRNGCNPARWLSL